MHFAHFIKPESTLYVHEIWFILAISVLSDFMFLCKLCNCAREMLDSGGVTLDVEVKNSYCSTLCAAYPLRVHVQMTPLYWELLFNVM